MSENPIVQDAFKHSVWATRTLLEACRALPTDQLTRDVGGFGSILATFDHYLHSDAAYAAHLGAARPAWASGPHPAADLDQLQARAEESERLWEDVLSSPVDAERVLTLEDGAYEVQVGVVVAQALHHANIHREQICAGLTALGVQPPDIQPWAYADTTGRGRWRDVTA